MEGLGSRLNVTKAGLRLGPRVEVNESEKKYVSQVDSIGLTWS